jgi:hypothetical protein
MTEARTAQRATTIAELHYGKNEVRAWNGIQVWNDYDSGDMRWHVFVRTGGQISAPPAIPTDVRRIDVGPGPDGRPGLAFVSCADVCQVVVSSLDGSHAQPVPGSTDATAVTLWGPRVAWVRRHKTVLTRRVNGGGIRRVRGVPRGRRVAALELRGSRVALIVRGNGETEVRMGPVRDGRQLVVARMGVGIANQAFQGPSWVNGKLFFFRSSPGSLAGPYRYDPRTGRYAKAPAQGPLFSFAMDDDGRRAFEILDPAPDIGPEPEDVTRLQLTAPLRFSPTRAPFPRSSRL